MNFLTKRQQEVIEKIAPILNIKYNTLTKDIVFSILSAIYPQESIVKTAMVEGRLILSPFDVRVLQNLCKDYGIYQTLNLLYFIYYNGIVLAEHFKDFGYDIYDCSLPKNIIKQRQEQLTKLELND